MTLEQELIEIFAGSAPARTSDILVGCLTPITKHLLCPAIRIDARLSEHGLTAVGMSVENVATAAQLFGRST